MKPTQSTHYSLISNGVLPLWLCILLGLLALAAVLLLLRRELEGRRALKQVRRMYAVRGAIVLAMAFLLAQPILYIRRETTQPAELVIVADRSRSMLRKDSYDGTELLDLAAAAGIEGLESRESLPQTILRALRREEESIRTSAHQCEEISDELAQGLPPGPGFTQKLDDQRTRIAPFVDELRKLAGEFSQLEQRIRDRAENTAGAKSDAAKYDVPYDPALFKFYAALLSRAEELAKNLSDVAGKTLTVERAAALRKTHEELAASWDAAVPALAALQNSCDQGFLKAQPEAMRASLKQIADLSRFDLAKRIVERLARNPAIAERHAVRLAGWEPLDAKNAGGDTDLFAPLDAIATGGAGAVGAAGATGASRRVIAGIALVTDGQQNMPERPEVLRRIAGRGIPFVAAGVGSANPLADVAILDYRIGRLQVAKKTSTIDVTLKTEVPAGTAIDVSLAAAGAGTAGSKVLAQRHLVADGNSRTSLQLTFTSPPEAAGLWTLAAHTEKPDAAPENDAIRFEVCVLQEPLRALIVARSPRWDLVHLMRALEAEPCRTDAVFWGTSKEKTPARGSGAGNIPETSAQLRKYQLIVLDDPPFPGMSEKDAALFRDQVVKNGGNLLLLANNAGPSYADSLSEAAGPQLPKTETASATLEPPPNVQLLTTVALAADGAQSLGRWRSLAPVRGLRQAPEQDLVLLTAAAKTPCLTLGFRGRGKIYVLSIGDLFRLREWNGAALGRFQSSLLEDALRPAFPDSTSKLAVYPATPAAGAELLVLADSPGAAAAGGPGKIKLPDGTEQPLDFRAAKMPLGAAVSSRANYALKTPGKLKIIGPQNDSIDVEAIASISSEDIRLSLDEKRLKRLAREASASGGGYTALVALPERLAALQPRIEREVDVREIRLWDGWILLIAIASLLTVDWVLRRRSGLVL